MANATFYNTYSTAPETVTASFSFVGAGAAQPTQIYGPRGLLLSPFAGTGLVRTGAGAYTVNLRDAWKGYTPNGQVTTNYQALVAADIYISQPVIAAPAVGQILFAGMDFVTNKTFGITFVLQGGTTPTDLTASMFAFVTLVFINSATPSAA
jgi:hypothetical protein